MTDSNGASANRSMYEGSQTPDVGATVADVHEALNGLWAAVSSGAVTPDEAAMLGKLLEQHAAVLEVSELEKRIEALERGPE
jgi:hypothetical protein